MDRIDINTVAAELISKQFESILSKLTGALNDQFQKLQVDFNLAFKQYLLGAYAKYSRVRTILYRTEPQYLYSFFECNTLSMGIRRIDASDVNQVLDLSHFLVLEGTGGIGKSTLMKHFFLNELEKKDLIPVFIELRELRHFTGTLFDFIYFTLNRLGFELDQEYLEYAMKSGCFLLLLDGFDEVDDSRTGSLYIEIDELCDRYRENYFIISSRRGYEFLAFHRFSVLRARQFTKRQALSMIRRLQYDEEIKERFLTQLDESLYRSHRSFASNPLLLTMMLLTFEEYAEIPARLHHFYANAFETLYQRHDATKTGFKREMKSGLSYHDFKLIFAEFCFRTYIVAQVQFTPDELHQVMKQLEGRYPQLKEQAFLDDLIQAVCMLYRDGTRYQFTHRSFQEYFTAFFLCEQPDERQARILLRMVDRGSRRMNNDKVFDMLWDMNPERFERNLLLPVLEELEEQVCNESDRYMAFFERMVPGVEFDDINFSIPHFFLVDKVVDNGLHKREEFVFHIAEKYYEKKLPTSVDPEFEGQVLGEDTEVSFTLDEILIDKELFAYVRKSWIGILVETASGLLETLREKHRRESLSLDELLV